jgi:hypothetical protein
MIMMGVALFCSTLIIALATRSILSAYQITQEVDEQSIVGSVQLNLVQLNDAIDVLLGNDDKK